MIGSRFHCEESRRGRLDYLSICISSGKVQTNTSRQFTYLQDRSNSYWTVRTRSALWESVVKSIGDGLKAY